MPNIKAVLSASKCPLFLFINDKETASDTVIKGRYFKEPSSGVGFVTNLEKAYSITENSNAQEVNPELVNEITVEDLAELDRMKDSEGNIIYMDAELAFDLSSMKNPFHSPLTGKDILIDYANDEEEEEEDTSEDTPTDEEDDSSEGDDQEEEIDVEIDVTDLEDEDSDGNEEDESEDDVENLSDEEDESSEDDDQEDDAEEQEEDTEKDSLQESVEVSMLDLVDSGKKLRVVSLGNNELACFVGELHVGTLKQTEARETASFLYADGNKLFHTFKDQWQRCSKTGKYDELASLGFVPSIVKVSINDLTLRAMARQVSEEVEKASVDQSSYKKRIGSLLSLAMVGIAKGVFVRDNPLTKEIATVLKRAGYPAAEAQARRILAKAAPGFAEAVLEQATGLETKSDAYLNGVTETVSKADYKSTEEETSDVGLLSTQFGGEPPVEEKEVASFIPHVTKHKKPTGEKYRGLFSSRPRA